MPKHDLYLTGSKTEQAGFDTTVGYKGLTLNAEA